MPVMIGRIEDSLRVTARILSASAEAQLAHGNLNHRGTAEAAEDWLLLADAVHDGLLLWLRADRLETSTREDPT